MSDSPIFDGLLRDHCYTSLDELTKWETPEFCWGPRFTVSQDNQCADTSHPVIEVPEAVQQTIKHYEERYNKMAHDMVQRLFEQNKTPSVEDAFSMELPKPILPVRVPGAQLEVSVPFQRFTERPKVKEHIEAQLAADWPQINVYSIVEGFQRQVEAEIPGAVLTGIEGIHENADGSATVMVSGVMPVPLKDDDTLSFRVIAPDNEMDDVEVEGTTVHVKPDVPPVINVETLGGEQLWARGYQS